MCFFSLQFSASCVLSVISFLFSFVHSNPLLCSHSFALSVVNLPFFFPLSLKNIWISTSAQVGVKSVQLTLVMITSCYFMCQIHSYDRLKLAIAPSWDCIERWISPFIVFMSLLHLWDKKCIMPVGRFNLDSGL